MSQPDRLHHLDAARSVLMALGVVFHAAQVYASGTEWLIKDDQLSPAFAWIAEAGQAFRMPAFFFISGLFCALTLERYGPRRFLSQRMPRIVVPLLTVGVLINAPQAIWLASRGVDLGDLTSVEAWLGGELWVFHLWFLLHLIVYFLLAALVGTAATRLLRRVADAAARRGLSDVSVALLLLGGATLVYLTIVPAHLLGILHADLLFFGSLFGLILYLGPFALGFAVMADARFAAAYFRGGWLAIPFHLMAAAAVQLAPPGPLHPLAEHLELLMLHLSGTYATLLVFRVIASRPSRFWLYASDAAYSVYLLHHPLVLLLGASLLPLAVPMGWKFTLVTLGALGGSLAVHHFVVLRLPLARWLLNGRGPSASPAARSVTGSFSRA